jgi:hypothetical protein
MMHMGHLALMANQCALMSGVKTRMLDWLLLFTFNHHFINLFMNRSEILI